MTSLAHEHAYAHASTASPAHVEIIDERTPSERAVAQQLAGELDVLATAQNYRDWLFSAVAPYIGQRVLEIGAGIGTMTDCVADRELVMALEYTPEYAETLELRFAANRRVQVIIGDATDTALMRRVAMLRPDSAMTFNVLEHIDDDVAALREIHNALTPGAYLTAVVPAFPALYGAMDRAVGHHRRYTRRELLSKARRVGFEVTALHHINLPGYFLWALKGRVLRRSNITGWPRMLRAFDRLIVPGTRALESRWKPPFGQSLVLAARRLVEA